MLKILVAEDDPNMVSVLSEVLRDERASQHRVQFPPQGRDFASRWMAHHNRIDQRLCEFGDEQCHQPGRAQHTRSAV